jgi:hypothetical protein
MQAETRFRMQRFIPSVGQRDERALQIIRRIESGTLSPSDALDALDALERCQEARH